MPSFRRIADRLRADPRLGRILHGGASALLGRGFAILVSAITLPLTVRYLGKVEYGVWITVATTVAMFSVLDLGIANTLTNFISQAYAQEDRESAQRYYATAFWVTSGLALVLGIAAWAVWRTVNWGSLLNITDAQLANQAKLCVGIAIAFFLFSLPLTLVNRVLSGYQQVHLTNYFAILNSALGLIAIVSVILLHGNLTSLMLAYCTAMLAGQVVLNLWLFVQKPWVRPHPSKVSPSVTRSLFGQGLSFFVLQLSGLVVFNSDNLVITHYLGPAEVTPYSVAWRIAGYAAILHNVFFPSLWPAYAEAYARRDFAWVRRAFWNTARLTLAVAAAAIIFIAFFGRWIIRLYAGAGAVPGEILLLGICGWMLLSTAMDVEAILLAAVGRVTWQGILSVAAALVNLALSIFLVKRIGSLGAVLGTIGSYLLVLVAPQTFIVWRALYRPESAGELGWRRPSARALLAPWFRFAVRTAALLGIFPRVRRGTSPRFMIVSLGDHVGDAVMLLPMIEELRRAHPEARLTCVVGAGVAPLFQGVPGIDHVYAVSPTRYGPSLLDSVRSVGQLTGIYWKTMRGERPSVCIAPRWGDDQFHALPLAFLTQAPQRIGFAANVRGGKAGYRDTLLTDRVSGGNGMPEPVRFVYLLQQAGLIAPELSLEQLCRRGSHSLRSAVSTVAWPPLAARLEIDDSRPLAVIAPGASMDRRRWPAERWAQVAQALDAAGVRVVVLGSSGDADTAAQIAAAGAARSLAGKTTLLESAAVIARAAAFLGSDSGPGHLAGALNVPSVILFIAAAGCDPDHPAAPERVRPIGPAVTCLRPEACLPSCEAVCVAESAHCIETIQPEAVIAAAIAFLKVQALEKV